MRRAILQLHDVHKSFGEAHIIRGAELELRDGERHAVIGPNGAGKSTLFHLISGQLQPTSGKIVHRDTPIQGRSPEHITHLGLSRSFQMTTIFPGLTVFENLRIAVMRKHHMQYHFWRSVQRYPEVREQTQKLLEQVRLQDKQSGCAAQLSYSEQRALEIGMTLASDPRVILLDEPMAGMSHEETDYALQLIREVTQGRSLLIVEHDMDVVFSLCDRISVLVYGQVIATGTPDEIRADRRVQEAYLGEEQCA